jgi:GH24 family phage-related lysozyme (muramidase)|tara:strand:+ start:13365 stop:13814 length:450 start_codon:yes stop_codon:yes gene_type:complete
MNVEQLRDTLKVDEGCVNSIYLDHLNLPTLGIGHLINEWDEEYGKPVGTPVSEERVNELFDKDIQITIDECEQLFGNFQDLPEEVQQILANMMFNLGRPRLSKFRKLCKAVAERNWKECAIQMEDSKWHKQVTKRADRLISRMNAVDST